MGMLVGVCEVRAGAAAEVEVGVFQDGVGEGLGLEGFEGGEGGEVEG